MSLRLVTLVIGALTLWAPLASAEKRVALVMGNSSYQSVSRLTNPVNDSGAISETLRSAGFDIVELKRDLKATEMRRALRDFSDNIRNADVAVVYFAGHGMEIDGVNYLIPVDAVLERDIDAFDEAIPLDRILTVIEPAKQLRLVILDACRDNPFNKTMKRTTGSRAVGRGLAKIDPTSPNTLIAFAARAGSTALDGDSKNSPFTAALIKHLPKPGLDLRKAFGFTRDDVMKATGNKQEPFVYGSLGGEDVSLVPALAAASAAVVADPNAAARRDYELALQISTRVVWDSFISNYPLGFYTDLAKAQRDKIIAAADSLAANERAKAAVEEQKRLVLEGAKATEQANAAKLAKVAEETRVEAEKKKWIEEARVAKVEQSKGIEIKEKAGEPALDNSQRGNGQPVVVLSALQPPQQKTVTSNDPAAHELPRLLRNELQRVGCASNSGSDWNGAAQRALALFNRHAQTKLEVKMASLDALQAVRSQASRICPLVCEHGYRVKGETCTKISCKAGFEVGDYNNCEKIKNKGRPVREPETPASSSSLKRTQPSAGPPRESGTSNQVFCTQSGCRPVKSGCRLEVSNRYNSGTAGQREVCN